MAFSQKQITTSITLANGNFGSSGGNSATLEGLRTSVKITNALPPSQGLLTADIYGLSLNMMNQLTVLYTNINITGLNTISIQAGDENGMALVFQGYIDTAFCNAQAMPQVSFHVTAHAASYPAVQQVQPTTQQGNASVSQLMSNLAQQMGLAFEDGGVTTQVASPYYYGSPFMQALELAEHAGIGWTIENGTLAIWPANGSRQGSMPLISPQTGLVGYPTYAAGGIYVKTLFDPSLQIKTGGLIQVQSDLTPACGTWKVVNTEYDLEAFTPRGEWFATMLCTNVGAGPE